MTPDEVLADYLERGAFDVDALGRLTAEEQAQVRGEQLAMDRLRAAFVEVDFWAEPDPALEDRVLAAVSADAGEATGTSFVPAIVAHHVAMASALSAGDDKVVSLAAARARRSRATSIGASLVAAAAVVVAVLALTTRPSTTSGDIAAPPITGTPSTTAAPAGLDLAVTGTDLAPGTSGRLRLDETSSGVRIALDMPGLPRRDNGQFYEAWVKTDKGLVPIGTFHSGTAVTLWSGISMTDFSAVTVTLEDNDGNQESSGRRIILAPLKPSPPGSTVPGSTAPGPTAPGTAPRSSR